MNTKAPTTAIILDTRAEKKDQTYPIKLRVTYNRISRFYGIVIEIPDEDPIDSLTEKEFEKVMLKHPRDRFKEIRSKLRIIEHQASEIIKKIKPFSFDAFSSKFNTNAGEPANIFYHYEQVVKNLKKNDQLGNASNYELSLKSFKKYITHAKGINPTKLLFSDITPVWLSKYERYMVSELERSRTTVGMYLRTLRSIFNMAIRDSIIDPGLYPFGKGKYEIPAGKKVKKALSKEQLGELFKASITIPELKKARDFWFFSYTCNGMNIKDIALLKFENLEADSLNFYRAKTRYTSREQVPVNVILTEFAKSVIQTYCIQDRNPKNFIFPILSNNDDEVTKRKKIQNFTRFINQHIKNLAKSINITGDISTYYARHSFATNAIRSGASIEFVSEALNHSDIKTTRGYFAGFTDHTKKELMEGLMDFTPPKILKKNNQTQKKAINKSGTNKRQAKSKTLSKPRIKK